VIRSVYDILAVVAGAAELALFLFVLFGPRRKFWVLALYAGWELTADSSLTLFDLRRTPPQRLLYSHLYWTNEVLVALLLFLVVVVLTHHVTPAGRARSTIDRFLILAGAFVASLPFLALHPSFHPWPNGRWFNGTVEILNFGAATMNLALWGALIGTRQRDPQLFKISAGLGVRLAGSALSYGIRHFVPAGVSEAAPNLLLMFTQIAGWLILCWAFWAAKPELPPPPEPPAPPIDASIPAASAVST
jgi:hypothetical protein